jgi:plasmid stabilization system protein ParE
MRLNLSPLIPDDLEEIGDSIALDSPRHPIRTLQLLRAKIKEISRQPTLYRLRPEIAPDARLAVVGQYVILFRIRNKTVRIERVLHGNRDLPDPFDEGK